VIGFIENNMRFEILYKEKGKIHKAARIYTSNQENLAKHHAALVKGKVRCRETGQILANYCIERKRQ
jgi:hypothetical protein